MLQRWANGLFKPHRTVIEQSGAEDFFLDEIADNTDFSRSGSGTTYIMSIGSRVRLSLNDSGCISITGNIGSHCEIMVDGNGKLTIEGNIANDLKISIWNRHASVIFARRPCNNVIHAIKNPVGATIICEGIVEPVRRYVQHNLGAVEPPVLQQPAHPNPPAPAPAAADDQFSDITLKYIENYKAQHHESIANQITRLGPLTAEEEALFENFNDTAMMSYFNDIPVGYNEKYYDLSSLIKIYHSSGVDPFTREPLKLANIQPARKILNDFEQSLKKVMKKREEAKQEEDTHVVHAIKF